MWRNEVIVPSSSPGPASFEEPSKPATRTPTRPPSASPMRWTSSTDPTGTPGLELLVQKWSSPTEMMAEALVANLRETVMAMSKATSPEFAGWSVHCTIYRLRTTVRLVWWVEPEDCPF